MKILQIYLISLFLFLSTGCAWVARDYYFESSVKNNEWNEEFQEGAWGDKSLHPATVIFSHTNNLIDFNFNINYQNPTCWSPLLIPVIPAPGQLFDSLYVDITVKAKDMVSFDVNSWTITDTLTHEVYHPNWTDLPMPKVLQKGERVHFFIEFPVKIKNIDSLKISFGPFSGFEQTVVPSALLLKKAKGDLQYNQFTL